MNTSQYRLAALFLRVAEAAFSHWTSHMARIAQSHGLTLSEISALYELRVAAPLNVSQLAQRTGLSKAATSQMVQRLVEEELVERRESSQSRREKQIALTERGLRVNQELEQAVLEETARVFQGVPEGLLGELNRLLEEAMAHLSQSHALPPVGRSFQR